MSKDYATFRQEALEKKVTFYETACTTAEHILTVKPNDKDRDKLLESIRTAHLDITPEGATSFATIASLFIIFIGIAIGLITFFFGTFSLFTTLLFVIGGALLIKPLTKLPNYFATRWRLEASNQMVLCILYVVMYMRHTSNLEHAIRFAGEHIGTPLSLDLKKVLWDVETGATITIKESLDHYLDTWRDYNPDFVESFHLIEGSLYEPTEQKRVELLDKALTIMLDGTYNNMLHYAHNLTEPITILYMLGIILPILGLVIFPLIGSFLGGVVAWYHLALLYNILLPFIVFFFGTHLLSTRPGGYGSSTAAYAALQRATATAPITSARITSIFIGGIIVLIGLSPLIIHWINPAYDATILTYALLDYKGTYGPYGFIALLLSLLIPLGIAIGVSLYYRTTTKHLITLREETDKLEQEFAGALFQLGNRVGDGLPAEIAFSKVAESMKNTRTGNFFSIVDTNIRQLGMNLHQAIFDTERGGILAYPSSIIETSMKVLIESARKGPQVISTSLLTISTYLNRITTVNERLRDLLADVLSGMVSQIKFLTPVIAGIVVGVGSMVVTIINLLGQQFAAIGGIEEGGFTGGVAAIASILRIEDVIPGFYFQAVIGVYLVEIVILLTSLSTTIERGVDPITTHYRIGTNLIKSIGLYLVIALIGIIVFNFLAQAVGVSTIAT